MRPLLVSKHVILPGESIIAYRALNRLVFGIVGAPGPPVSNGLLRLVGTFAQGPSSRGDRDTRGYEWGVLDLDVERGLVNDGDAGDGSFAGATGAATDGGWYRSG
jgi:hypothetical protein